jgi:ATP-binding cassette, subfamily C (CFTR/MRP), member 1
MKDSIVFSRLMDEYGSLDQEEEAGNNGNKTEGAGANAPEEVGGKKADSPLMQTEERNTGSVTWEVYSKYLRFAGGVIWAPVILALLTLTQGAQGKISC